MPSLIKKINQKSKTSKVLDDRSSNHKKLSSSIEDVDDQHSNLNIDLQKATEEGNEKNVAKLLTIVQANPALKESAFLYSPVTGDNILHVASRSGDHRILNMLLDIAKSINDTTLRDLLLSEDKSGRNSLHIASSENYYLIVQQVLSAAENISDNHQTLRDLLFSKDWVGENSLYLAATYDYYLVVRELLSAAENDHPHTLRTLLLSTNKLLKNALHRSAFFDNGITISEILNYAQLVNDKNETLKVLILSCDAFHTTALHIGALYGNTVVVTKLLDAAKIAGKYAVRTLLLYKDSEGLNALQIASNHEHTRDYIKVATKLLDFATSNGKDIVETMLLSTNSLNENILHICASHTADTLMTKLLNIARNLSVPKYGHEHNVLQKLLVAYNKPGKSVLHVAADNTNGDLIRAVLGTIRNMDGSKKIMEQLLFHIDYSYANPLYASILNTNHQIFSIILDALGMIDNVTFKGLMLFTTQSYDSVLHTLVFRGRSASIEYLFNVIKNREEVKYNNQINELGGYIDVVSEVNHPTTKMIKSIKCDNEYQRVQIIECFHSHQYERPPFLPPPREYSFPGNYVHIYMSYNAEKCIKKAQCINLALKINLDKCSNATQYVQDKNNILISVLMHPNKLGYNVLHLAAYDGDTDAIKHFVNEANDIDTWKYRATKEYTTDNKCTNVVTKNHGQIQVSTLLNEIKSGSNTFFSVYLLSTVPLSKDSVLHMAIQGQNTRAVNELLHDISNLANGNDVLKKLLVSTNKQGDTVLHKAIQKQDAHLVERFLRYAKNIGDNDTTLKKLLVSTNDLGENVLNKAVQKQDAHLVERFLRYAKNIADNDTTLKKLLVSTNDLGENVLNKAVQKQDTHLVERFLRYAKNIADNNATLKQLLIPTNNFRETAFYKALQMQNTQIVLKLLSYAKHVRDNNTTLKKLLIFTDDFGETALHKAAQKQDTYLVEKLLSYAETVWDNNATLKYLLMSTDTSRETALHKAAREQNAQIAEKLLSYAGNILDNNTTLKQLLMFTNSLGEIAACTAYNTRVGSESAVVALIIGAAVKAKILPELKIRCTIDNYKVEYHEYKIEDHEENLDRNIRTKRDIKHKHKGITHHYDKDNTQGVIIPTLTKSLTVNTVKAIPDSVVNYGTLTNQVSIQNLINMFLVFGRYFFPTKSASDIHYISPHTQHEMQLDELALKVDQALAGEVLAED